MRKMIVTDDYKTEKNGAELLRLIQAAGSAMRPGKLLYSGLSTLKQESSCLI